MKIQSRSLSARVLVLIAALCSSSGAFAADPDCRTWNPDSGVPHECHLLLKLREMEHVRDNNYGQSDNLMELFVVLGPNDQLQGVQYIKNRGTSYGPGDRDSGGAPRLGFVSASVAQLEQSGGVVMNPNHDVIKLAILSGFDVTRGGIARIDYLTNGVSGNRTHVDYSMGHNIRGDWALFVPGDQRPITALDAYTNYGFMNMVIGVRNIAPEFGN